MGRYHNFSAGPAALPLPVLEEANRELLDFGHGASILETSHRSAEFTGVLDEANASLRALASIPETHDILWLQGGASMQFAMVPLNFLKPGQVGTYVMTGTWSDKALVEGNLVGETAVAASSKETGYDHIPAVETWDIPENAAFVHTTSNNTIFGTQFAEFPADVGAPLVCDMSSDILCRPTDFSAFDLVYAGAQKNLGPSGVTLAIVRKSWMEESRTDISKFLRYATHSEKGSTYNTPPVYPIYLVGKVLKWLTAEGGLEAMHAQNQAKAKRVYDLIDENSGFFKGHAREGSRSIMNITFNLPSPELEAKFVAEAQSAGLVGLKGHRSVGGIRASIYNAVPPESVEALAAFMERFLLAN